VRYLRTHIARPHTIALAVALCAALAMGSQFAVVALGAPSAVDAATAKAKVDAMSGSLSTTLKSYSVAADELSRTRAAIAANTAKTKRLDASIATGRVRLAAEARFLYLTGGIGFAEILLGSSTLDDFIRRSEALKRITARDAKLVERLTAEQAERTALRADLARRERTQAALVARLGKDRAAAQKALDAQQAYVDSLSADVAAALDAKQAANNSSHTRPVSRPKPGTSGAVVSAKVVGRSGSYSVLSGQPTNYAPTGVKFTGVATWYGNVRPNMRTASGRPFNENELTCAHKTLPFGTRVAVTFRGKSVIVTVTDRGPYGRGRVIDLSKRAATIIGMKSAGVGNVTCEVVRPQ
jgi:rare lipoprotein A (peptidoglycan hydrolase)